MGSGDMLTWIMVGIVAGGLAGALVPARAPIGLVGVMACGVLGALVGGILFSALHITALNFLDQIKISLLDIVVAFIGAVIVLVVVSLIFHRRP